MSETITSMSWAKKIREHSLQMTHTAKSSHIGAALSIADILAVLYFETLRIDANDPKWPNRDRFILSKGHACAALYATLALRGFIPIESLKSFGNNDSDMMTHISHKVLGVEFSTGSLGHGLPFGVGQALAAKTSGQDWKTFVLVGDGELDEGSNWEAALFAAHHKLSNLVLIVDSNKLQSLTTTDETLRIEPIEDKFRAFGWDAERVNGHNHDKLKAALGSGSKSGSRPKIIIADTIKGKGVSFMENQVLWHYKNPDDEQLALAISEINGKP